MADDQPGTIALLARELGRTAEPLADAVESGPDGVRQLLDDAGLGGGDGDVEKLLSALDSAVARPIQVLRKTVLAEEPSVDDVDEVLTAIEGVFTGLRELDDVDLEGVDVDALGEALLDHLVVTYLRNYHRTAHSVLSLTGVIVDDASGREDLDLSQVGRVLQDPASLPKEVFNWGDDQTDFLAAVVLYYLKVGLWNLGVPASMESPPVDHVTALAGASDIADLAASADDLDPQLRIPIVQFSEGDTRIVAGVKIVPLPAKNDRLPGLAVVVYGRLGSGVEWPLGDGWTFNVAASGEVANRGVGLQPTADGSLDSRLVSLDGDTPSVDLNLKASIRGGPDRESPLTLLGTPGATRLDLTSVGVEGMLDYTGDDLTIRVELPSTGELVISPSGGFLETVLPEDVTVEFEATVGWSSADSLYFEGGGTLEASIPLHLDLGFARIEELYLALDPTAADGDLTVSAATSPAIALGPLQGRVRRMGVEAGLSFPDGSDGNAGPLQVDVGFRPPDGLALSVDTGAVSGGGFMTFEPEKHRYTGGLELQFGSWGLKVVGLLKTKLPGTHGYSLLLLVTADLPPIQLGFGFVMTGIGGLAGIHRGFETKALGDAVRSGTLDSVLFPEDVVANADQIVTDLRAIFPPKADRHVFGPMLRLGWGTPVIITAELGVLVSIPTWKVALVGKFMVDLPDEEVALIDLNLAVVGVLDVPNQELSIDASLYDSRLAAYTVSGDMAMRLSWGDDARFMLSVGGFHPRYDPPSTFPKLDRVRAALSVPGGNPRLELTGYLAVTPNTFQVGAGVVLHGEFGPAVVHGELSFDALFRFNPFEFVVDVYAGVSVKIKGHGLSLKLDGTLSGPGPYRIRGKLSIEILFISITVSVDATFGRAAGSDELPTADVLPELVAALEQPASWSVQKPAGGTHLVTLHDPNAGAGEASNQPSSDTLLAHPLGTLAVRQQVVPLGVTIEKYGNAKPRHTRFELSTLSVAGSDENLAGQRELRERFAPARFKELSDSEKLQAEPFERLPAGQTMENGIAHYAGADDPSLLSWATLAYESSVIDADNDQYRLDAATAAETFGLTGGGWDGRVGLALGHELAEGSAVATAETRTTGSAAYTNPDTSKRVSLDDQRFVVAWTDDVERVPFAENPAAGQTRIEAQEARESYLASHDVAPDEVQVVGVQELGGGSGGGPL